MDAFESRFRAKLRGAVEARIVELTRRLIDPPAEDYPSYRAKVGLIKGLELALEISEETEQAMGRGDDKPKDSERKNASSRYEG
jgi:hypothetical protein